MLKFRTLLVLLSPTLAVAQPSFTNAGTFPVGSSPQSIAVADFNGDGKLDLATANASDNTVTVLLGDGAGRFSQSRTFPTGNGPIQVLAADFNRDGRPDLVVLNSVSNTLSVLLGNGSGGFTPASASPVSAGMSPTSMVMADFNLDGTPDLAIANESGLVSIYLGNGSGGFTASPTPAFPSGRVQVSITAGDLNGDGKPDLLVIPSGVQFPPAGTTMAYLLPGTGDGSFQTPLIRTMLIPATLFSLAVGDFNGDGRPDVAAVDSFGFGNLSLLMNDSQHGLLGGVPVFSIGGFCYSIAVA
ncbi:MAG: VCBS repeat-containing protein, partial [Acidobacteriia bacterium]|nr:VCBS repeat-containing protein [Terriglobia bacterium]